MEGALVQREILIQELLKNLGQARSKNFFEEARDWSEEYLGWDRLFNIEFGETSYGSIFIAIVITFSPVEGISSFIFIQYVLSIMDWLYVFQKKRDE